MKVRVVVGILAAAVVLVSIWIHAWVFTGLIVLCSFVALYEMRQVLAKQDIRLIWIPLAVYAALMTPAYYFLNFQGLLALLLLCGLLCMASVVASKRVRIPDVFFTGGTLLYPLLPISICLAASLIQPDGLRYYILIQALACTYLADTFALFTGMLLGKHKLCERLSPKKTVEGLLGGTAGSMLGGLLCHFLLSELWNVSFHLIHALVIGAACALLGVAGDLSASAIKRYAKVKDFGSLFPGHGGMLDRIDSLLFALPFVFIYYQVII